MAVLPQALRRAVPERVRDDVRLRALAVGAGLIPPRTLHSDAERALLQELARDAARVVEIGVYEGASAAALCAAMRPDAELHLIDPFGHHPTALPAGWGAIEQASRRVVARAAHRHDGPRVIWHVERSEDTGRRWSTPVDVVFIDGDHAEAATRSDWELFSPHVTAGGHVLFHDAIGPQALPGPSAVVAEISELPGWEVAAEVDRTLALTRAARGAAGGRPPPR